MTAREVAERFGVKRFGFGRKWRARCPAHRSRGLTLAIYDDGGKVGVHCHAGCKQDDVLACVDLTWKDLKPDCPTPQVLDFRADERRLERYEARLGAVLYLMGADRANASHWEAVRQRLLQEIEPLYWKVEPDRERFDKVRAWELKDYANRRMDFLRRQHDRRTDEEQQASGS